MGRKQGLHDDYIHVADQGNFLAHMLPAKEQGEQKAWSHSIILIHHTSSIPHSI